MILKNNMYLKNFKGGLWLFRIMIIFILSAILFSCRQKNGRAEKPNILFILADDQRADALGCMGNSYIRTPNLDHLAKGGTLFTGAYILGGHHGAVCAPSRAMLMSGRNMFHLYAGLDKNKWMEDLVLNRVTTMPAYFGNHGYVTFGTGKWHHGAESFEASFQNGKNVFLGGMSDHFNVPCRDLDQNGKLGDPVNRGFSTDQFAEAAIHFITEHALTGKEKPFFCYVAFTAPHDPRSPQNDYLDTYPAGTIPAPGNFMDYHPFAFDHMQVRDENLAPWPRTPEIIQASLADYYALITHLDFKVGEIIEALKKNGLYDNTIIVYSADNGLALGSHGLLGKQNLYEHSTRIPLIIRGPGIPANKTMDSFVYLHDLFPTLCQLTGLPAIEGLDGENFGPVIRGENKGIRSSVFTAYRNTIRAVRNGEWKLIRYPDRDFTQLFDLKNDPLELYNLAGDTAVKPMVEKMKTLLYEWQVSEGDSIPWTADTILPLDYNPLDFVRIPDPHQPEYTIKKYFNLDLKTQ